MLLTLNRHLMMAIDSQCSMVRSSGAKVSNCGRNIEFHQCQCERLFSYQPVLSWGILHCRRRVLIRHATKTFGAW